MKIGVMFPIVILSLAQCCSLFGQATPNPADQQPNKADPGYSITLSGPSAPIRVGSPITVVIQATVGDKAIGWRGQSAYTDFQFSLQKDGREVDTTLFHRRITGKLHPGEEGDFSGSSVVFSLPPGKSLTFPIDVTKLYDIKEPGVYKLDVSRYDEFTKRSFARSL